MFDRGQPQEQYNLVTLEDEFSLEAPSDFWVFRTPDLWLVAGEGDRRMLRMLPPPERPMLAGVRRPQEYAIHTRYQFRSFALLCHFRVDNAPDVAGRDACVIFGRRDDTHFYYVHLSNTVDAFHNALVRVDGDTRTSLVPAGADPKPAAPDRNWHKIDILRDADTGRIAVYLDAFDQSARPWMEVRDKTYEWGHVGLGSFNDHASFARFLVEGQAR